MNNIIIKGVREGNLKDISLEIPKNRLVVFTGLSGSGKTTLADVIFKECQRQYLEAMGLQGIRKPRLKALLNASPAIIITQKAYAKNPRSTVGTATDIYTGLRMLYEKLSKRSCPECKREIAASECREAVEGSGDSFKVYSYCCHCGHKMEKLTRSQFSFNTEEGACGKCQGLGKVLSIDEKKVIHEDLSLEEGAIDYWEQRYKEYQIAILYKAFKHYGLPAEPHKAVAEFNDMQREILFHGIEGKKLKEAFPQLLPPKTTSEGRFEGVLPILWRRYSEGSGTSITLEKYFHSVPCPHCEGEGLNQLSRSATVMDTRLPQLSALSLEELVQWLIKLDQLLNTTEKRLAEDYLLDLRTKLQRLINVGLGYLSLNRQTMTLSGGEAQRIKLASILDATLTGIIYIMDEPTVGLHPKDTAGIIKVLKELRDRGNTVIIIEHDTDVIKEADYIIDIGPGAGKYGGEIVARGTLEELMKQTASATAAYLTKAPLHKPAYHKGTGKAIEVKNANRYNLKNINVSFPIGCLTSVTGVSGSGKSTLVFEVLARASEDRWGENNIVLGTEDFHGIITVYQSPVSRMKRSNVATYSGVYSEIRKIYGGLKASRDIGLGPKHFSFNSKGGRCEACEGLGYVTSNLLFFQEVEVPCPVCRGNQFEDRVLSVKYKGYSIKELLGLSVDEGLDFFMEHPKILKVLSLLKEVGLGYLELGQSLTTLSGGEAQRLKLAKELTDNEGSRNLYLIDEPTTGLHPIDVENFLGLLNKIVAAGNTVIVVEHNQQVIRASDWVIDLGPEGGVKGGEVIATGTPEAMKANKASVTGRFL